MAKPIRVTLEIGPHGKKVVAVAPDWPGLSRGGATGEAAVERLLAYVPRYAAIAKLAGMQDEFANISTARVVERYPGTGSTDFWGISFAFSRLDRQRMSDQELERQLALLRACWKFFDTVRSRVSPEMAKGPRGGGRDRDRIVRHVVANEADWAKKLGVLSTPEELLSKKKLNAFRDAYCDAIRALHSRDEMARNWHLRYLIRHTAFHMLDHTWEMQDKDLTVKRA